MNSNRTLSNMLKLLLKEFTLYPKLFAKNIKNIGQPLIQCCPMSYRRSSAVGV